MSEYITEKNFLIAEGAEGDIYFFVEAKHQHPSAPKIIYDGRDHAVFIRNPEQKIILDYINPEVRDKLRKAKEAARQTELWLPAEIWVLKFLSRKSRQSKK